MKALVYIAMGIMILGLAALVPAFGEDEKEGQEAQATTESQQKTAEEGTTEAIPKPKPAGNPMVLLETNYGNITVELFMKQAPLSVENFLSYVKDGFYDGTVFHRVVKGFVLQAGGMTEDMKQKKQKAAIKNEATNGISNKRGTLSMARTSAINSGTSHFFINLVDNTPLDHKGMEPATYGYAVFGNVAEGMDVVDKIAEVKVTTKGQYQNVPVKPVIIKKATMIEAEEAKKAAEKEPAEEKTTKDLKKEEKKIKDE